MGNEGLRAQAEYLASLQAAHDNLLAIEKLEGDGVLSKEEAEEQRRMCKSCLSADKERALRLMREVGASRREKMPSDRRRAVM